MVAMNQEVAAEQTTRVGHMAALNIYSEPSAIRRTSIVCTIGPKSGSVEKLTELRAAGMNVMRLNFSHGSYEFHGGLISNLHESCARVAGPPVAIALDTKGPEIRTGILVDGDVKLLIGDVLTFRMGEEWFEKGTKSDVYCDYKNLPNVISIGDIIFIDDGLLSAKVTAKGADYVVTEIANNGLLGSRKGCNLSNVNVDLPALSVKDKADLKWGVEQGVDMIFASFIRKAQDIFDIRATLGEAGKNVKIIAKIENHEGIQNFPEILAATDGVMVARGDLGIEVASEKVFLAQKMMISMCNLAGKPVICATQMLDSMTYNPRPTRAEVSDVANAVLDGADCVMLSGETAKGDYAVETVQMMGRICKEAEAAFLYKVIFNDLKSLSTSIDATETMGLAAVEAAYAQKAAAIIVLSQTGASSRMVSKFRPRCPILLVTRDEQVARQAHLSRDVFPMVYNAARLPVFQEDVDARLSWALKEAVTAGYVKAGETVITLQGWTAGSGHTNTLRTVVVPQ